MAPSSRLHPVARAAVVRIASAVLASLALGACHDNVEAGASVDTSVEVVLPPRCASDQCDILGSCWDNGEANPANPCEACVVLVDRARFSADDSGSCDDRDACTEADACQGGRCVGTPKRCDDGDPCTVDACDSDDGTCAFAPAPDKCGDDPCAATPAPDCDDHDPCTADRCQAHVGCVHDAAPASEPIACDDHDACTSGDLCDDGVCVGQAPTSCDDGDLCTIDLCTPEGGCAHTSIASLCTDANPCTDERCDPEKGCVYPFNSVHCNDENACTAGDTCQGGACLGTPVSPDDLNPCTDDACDPKLGVINVPNALPCDDTNACTVGDFCRDASCHAGPDPLACDDSNQCTDDACDPQSGCTHSDHTRPCDDHNACTAGDTCGGGACTGSTVECDDGNACTVDSCNPQSGCVNELIVSNACRPTITVDFPARGATLVSGGFLPLIAVTGHVSSGAGPITSFKVNGNDVPVAADQSFSYVMAPTWGGNILVLDAVDALGSPRKRVQSFLWSNGYRNPTTPKNGIVTEGLGVWLDKLAIDDGNRSSPPNDLASILQVALRNFNIGALIPSPVYNNYGALNEDYDIYIKNLTYSPPNAYLAAQNGGIHLTGVINNGSARVEANRDGCNTTVFGVCVTPAPSQITGTVTWTSLVINVDLDLSVAANDIVVTVRASDVQINGLDVHIDGLFGWLADFILGFFLDSLSNTIENAFNDQLRPVIGNLVRDGLRELAFQIALDIPKPNGGSVPIDLVTDFQAVTCTGEGCKIVFRSGAYSDFAVTPYSNLGVPNRAACGGGTQSLVVPEQRILELSLADDTLNQVLFAAWRGGILEFPVPSSWLSGVDLGQFGITNLSMAVSGMLAPTLADCGRSTLGAHVGDVKITASMKLFGQTVNVVVWGSMVAGVDLRIVAAPGGGNEIALRITGIERLDTEIDVLDEDLIALEDVIRDLIEERVLNDLVGQLAGKDLGSIPLPNIDLSGAIAGLPPGTAIRIFPEALDRMSGNTVAGGRLY
ncbi:MAG: hypothetical protein U1F43_10935 [Myxococcota bacterium]